MHQRASHSSPTGDHQVLLSQRLVHKGQLITVSYYFTSSQRNRACSLPVYLVREEPLSLDYPDVVSPNDRCQD